MPKQLNMATLLGSVFAFIWSMYALGMTYVPGQFHTIFGVDGATHLQTAQSLVLGISYLEGLIWVIAIAAVIGSLLAQVDFDLDEA